jgi:septum formation protein
MLILNSQSPRRAEILRQANIAFRVQTSPVDEASLAGEAPGQYVERVAELKARAVEGDVVLGADTTVVVDGQMLGKPADAADARRMLRLLAGRSHDVMTGICLKLGDRVICDRAVTRVWFAPMTEAEIEAYASGGEPMDKAGAYAIQGIASRYVERIDGCYFNVMGLPVSLVYRRLREAPPGMLS